MQRKLPAMQARRTTAVARSLEGFVSRRRRVCTTLDWIVWVVGTPIRSPHEARLPGARAGPLKAASTGGPGVARAARFVN